MATTLTKLLTADDLLRLDSEGVRGELIRGVLYETMPAGMEHGGDRDESGHFARWVHQAAEAGAVDRLGRWCLAGAGPGYRARARHRLYLGGAIAAGLRVRGYAEVVPDLVVEIVSPSDGQREGQ